MKRHTEIGMNRTGMDLSKIMSQQMADNANIEATMSPEISSSQSLRSDFFKSADAIGTVPLPGTLKGIAKTAMQKLSGDRPEVLIDKLGERMAFERTGTRLYELMIIKCEADEETPAALIELLRGIHAEEEKHFHLLHDIIKSLGADPTAITPSADSMAVMSSGLIQSLSDPRTSVAQGLEALLTAELVDEAGWDLLSKLLDDIGVVQFQKEIEAAMQAEERHLVEVRSWYSTFIRGQALKKDLPQDNLH
ncbi:MAG: ferritin Dps family protein [Oligoflexus sp.]